MKTLTITENDKGEYEVAMDGAKPQTVPTIDEALTAAADAFGGDVAQGEGEQGADQGAPPTDQGGPAASENTDAAAESDQADLQGMFPKKKPDWGHFMMGPERK